jgi:uncharacterized protein YyaL (SSP411 family)
MKPATVARMRRTLCLLVLGAAAVALAAPAGRAAADEQGLFLQSALTGISRAHHAWWNRRLGWYDDRLDSRWNRRMPLARLWSAYPLFEAVDAVALARPTAAHRAAVRAFAAGARRYFDPNLRPVGGYTYYPGITRRDQHTYFDDNGWWAIAFLDAYRATHDRVYLRDAEKAVRFVDRGGWDSVGGGTWWETLHLHKTSEPLGAVAYVASSLYRITHERSYLALAEKYVDFADSELWDGRRHLYTRNARDDTPLDYVEGMMIGAHVELCEAGRAESCTRAEEVADASVATFRSDWAPTQDAIYLRFLLDLYRHDHDRRWYEVVAAQGRRALQNARGRDGLYLRRWSGENDKLGLLQTHAGTTSLFAWLAATPPPA